MPIHSGYKTVTPIQLANAVWALQQRLIDQRGLRVYLACFALVAAREAAKRYRKARGEKPKERARYRMSELEGVTGLPPRAIRRALAQLSGSGLVNFSEGEIDAAREPVNGSEQLLEVLSCSRSPRRPIPVPRSMLRFLAGHRSQALAKVAFAYVLRGLGLTRSEGRVTHKGTVKISWIAASFGLSERATRYARAQLIGLGWIAKDTGSVQRKLNRDGAYFVINLDWSVAVSGQRAEIERDSCVAQAWPQDRAANLAPRPPSNCGNFAPPYKNKKTSYEDKHQKARNSEPTGVSKLAPRLQNIVQADLYNFERLETLYGQAVQAGWIAPSEATALNFIGAAIRAREIGNDPARVFVSIVKRGLWSHISLAQEDHAHRTLKRFRQENPERFRLHRQAALMPIARETGPFPLLQYASPSPRGEGDFSV